MDHENILVAYAFRGEMSASSLGNQRERRQRRKPLLVLHTWIVYARTNNVRDT